MVRDLSWGAFTVWGVVNAVNLLQSTGFISRVVTGGMAVNHMLGYVMIALAAPAAAAMVALGRAGAGWRQWVGSAVYLAFVLFMAIVEYILKIEFRSPLRPSVLALYLTLFFGAVLLMGTPMFGMHRGLWLVTVATTLLLIGSMVLAMRRGMG